MGEGGGRRSLLESVDITTEESLEPGSPAPALRRVDRGPWEDQREAAGPPGPAPLGGRGWNLDTTSTSCYKLIRVVKTGEEQRGPPQDEAAPPG